jgi:hypothetical protein
MPRHHGFFLALCGGIKTTPYIVLWDRIFPVENPTLIKVKVAFLATGTILVGRPDPKSAMAPTADTVRGGQRDLM